MTKRKILDDIIAMIARVHGFARKVARHDRELARQMRDAATSTGLNAAEGVPGHAGSRTARLDSAMCSGRETLFAIRIAGACGYLDGVDVAAEVDDIDRIVAPLDKLAHR